MGFEPTTFSLARRRTTTVLRPQIRSNQLTGSAETQDRTGDTAIFSRVLYQLSYLGERMYLLSARDFTRTHVDLSSKVVGFIAVVLNAKSVLDFLYPLRYNVRSLSKRDS